MAVVRVHRGVISQVYENVGTQYIGVGGAFQLDGYVIFELDPTVFTLPGIYVLVDYSAGSFTHAGIANGQDALDTRASVEATGTGLTVTALTNDVANSRITVTLS